jgi:predicted transcriptional regulator
MSTSTGEPVLSEVEFLARSVNRFEILAAIESAPKTSRELKDELGLPRTTLRRNLLELQDRNWIRSSPTENVYRISPAGETIVDGFADLLEQAATADKLATFLDQFGHDLPVDTDALEGCEVVCPEPSDPHAPVQRLIELVQGAGELSVLIPSISPFYVDMFTRRLGTSPSFDIVTTPDAVDAIEGVYPDEMGAFLDGDERTVSLNTELPGFGICLHDAGAFVLTFTDDQRVHAVLEVTEAQPEIVGWASDTFGKYSDGASVYDR